MKYEVDITIDGTTSAIDTIDAEEGYTAEQYVADCLSNADEDWNEMLAKGTVALVPID